MGVWGTICSLEGLSSSTNISENQEFVTSLGGMLAANHWFRDSLLPSVCVEISQKDIQRRGFSSALHSSPRLVNNSHCQIVFSCICAKSCQCCLIHSISSCPALSGNRKQLVAVPCTQQRIPISEDIWLKGNSLGQPPPVQTSQAITWRVGLGPHTAEKAGAPSHTSFMSLPCVWQIPCLPWVSFRRFSLYRIPTQSLPQKARVWTLLTFSTALQSSRM